MGKTSNWLKLQIQVHIIIFKHFRVINNSWLLLYVSNDSGDWLTCGLQEQTCCVLARDRWKIHMSSSILRLNCTQLAGCSQQRWGDKVTEKVRGQNYDATDGLPFTGAPLFSYSPYQLTSVYIADRLLLLLYKNCTYAQDFCSSMVQIQQQKKKRNMP